MIKYRADLACFATIFIGAGLIIWGMFFINFGLPEYVYVIRDTLGLVLCIIGVYFASEWFKRGRQESEMEREESTSLGSAFQDNGEYKEEHTR